MTALDVNPPLKGFLDSALISLCDRVEALAPGSIAGLTISQSTSHSSRTRDLSTATAVCRRNC